MFQQPASVMRRRVCIAGAIASVLPPLTQIGYTQSLPRLPRVGCLLPDLSQSDKRDWLAFVSEMSQHGWIEGRTILFDKRFVQKSLQRERLDALALELAALNVDVIYAGAGTAGALAAKKATKTIPIVFRSSADPVGLGLVESLGRPTGNLTGSAILALDIDPKAMQFLAQTTGKLSRFAYIEQSANRSAPYFPNWSTAMISTAEKLGAKIEFVDLESDGELVPTLKRLVRQGFDSAMCETTAQFKMDPTQVAALFIEHKLPTIGDARVGFLLHYNFLRGSLEQVAAAYVDRILRGARPSELPVQQASKFELVINLKTAKALGVTVPRELRERADELVQ